MFLKFFDLMLHSVLQIPLVTILAARLKKEVVRAKVNKIKLKNQQDTLETIQMLT